MKKQTVATLKKNADKYFSQYVRYRDGEFKRGDWLVECITCGIEKPLKEMQAYTSCDTICLWKKKNTLKNTGAIQINIENKPAKLTTTTEKNALKIWQITHNGLKTWLMKSMAAQFVRVVVKLKRNFLQLTILMVAAQNIAKNFLEVERTFVDGFKKITTQMVTRYYAGTVIAVELGINKYVHI